MSTDQEQYVVDGEGKRTAVILPAEQYEQMIEDIHDLAVLAERRDEETINLAEIKQRMNKYGLL